MEVTVVLITFPTLEVARQIGSQLVEKKLAACVNLVPQVESIYQWEGEVKNDPEVLAMVKTTVEGYERLERAVLELHPYDTPEIIALPLSGGVESYLNWVKGEVSNVL